MIAHRPTPTSHSTMVRVLTVVVLPVAIYVLQLLGKVSALAALVAGILLGLKVLLELLSTPASVRPFSSRRRRSTPSIQCHYSQRHHIPLRLHPNPDHRLPSGTQVCESCYERYLLTATYMSTHYEPL